MNDKQTCLRGVTCTQQNMRYQHGTGTHKSVVVSTMKARTDGPQARVTSRKALQEHWQALAHFVVRYSKFRDDLSSAALAFDSAKA